MAATLDLPFDKIDRLLSEAEARLSGNDAGAVAVGGASSADALTAVPPAKALASAAAPVASTAGEQTAVAAQKPGKLTVRVPQPTQKKKVRALLSLPPSSLCTCTPVCDEIKSQSK